VILNDRVSPFPLLPSRSASFSWDIQKTKSLMPPPSVLSPTLFPRRFLIADWPVVSAIISTFLIIVFVLPTLTGDF